MRIAIVAPHRELFGGAETYLRWLLGALVAHGHEVGFAFELPCQDQQRASDLGIEPLRRWDLDALKREAFLEELQVFRPDVVFSQGARDDHLDRDLTRRFPTALFAHGFYGACATGWRAHDRPQREVCKRRFGPACLALNYLKGCGARNPLGLVDLYRSQRRRSKLLPDLSALVVASEYVRQVFVEHGVRAQDVHVIPPPAERAADPSPPERRELGNHVLFLGRLASGKGGAHAVEAVAGAQRDLGRALRLTVAGEGPELEHCRQLAAQLDVTSEFTGWVGGERRQALLRGADVLIVPSLWPEPFGIVGLEAGGVGLPAAAYNVGGIGEWLRAGVTGELADGPGFDPLTLGSALARVLRDGSHYARLRLGAWQMSQEFSGERHLARLEVLFRAIASSGDR